MMLFLFFISNEKKVKLDFNHLSLNLNYNSN